jgi:ATP-dependent DNA helicase RecQ
MAYGSEFRELLAEGTPDGEADAAVVDAAVEVLAQWKDSWPERPGAVASIGSRRRPVLIGSIGARLAEIGRLPYLGVLEHLGDRTGREANSAHRLRSVWEAYQAPPDFVRALEQHRGAAVLLVDDFVDTGWTMTVVARMLLNLGARRVYPFALAVVG